MGETRPQSPHPLGAPPGSTEWFREHEGLNDSWFIPGFGLPRDIMCKEKVVATSGKKNLHNGFRYRRHMSRRQARRVRCLYQRVHQRPIDRNDDISLKFAIALLDERDGHQTNWCALGEQFCNRRREAFDSSKEYRSTWRWKERRGH